MTKKINIFAPLAIIGIGLIIGYLIVANAVNAQSQTSSDIFYSYPIKELGDCQDEASCRAFCDNSENISACVSFAQKHSLISKEEAKKIKTVDNIKNGPGGCRGKEQCAAFCDNPDNMSVCLDFAEKNNLMSQDELKEARQIAQALKQGAQLPGNCKNKKDCEAYCNDSTHINECLDFAEKSGFIPTDEIKEARLAAKAISTGIKPPGNCRGKKECDIYCSDASHGEECLSFAEAAGFIPKEEAVQVKKMMSLMNNGQTPGNCKSKDQCESYCADAAHSQECADFAIKTGIMNPEKAEMFKRTGGKGPGGCQGKDECEAFCNNPENQETCFDFAKENGLMPSEKIQGMKEGVIKIKEGISNMPPEILDCLKSSLGTEIIEKIQKGELAPGPQIGDSMQQCFGQFNPTQMTPSSGTQMLFASGTQVMPPPFTGQQEDFKGLGGCRNFEECKDYCQSHLEECVKFGQRLNNREGEDINKDYESEKSEENRFFMPPILMPDSASDSIKWMPHQENLQQNIVPPGQMPLNGKDEPEYEYYQYRKIDPEENESYQNYKIMPYLNQPMPYEYFGYPTGTMQFEPLQNQMPYEPYFQEKTQPAQQYMPTEQPSTSDQLLTPSVITIFLQVFKGVFW